MHTFLPLTLSVNKLFDHYVYPSHEDIVDWTKISSPAEMNGLKQKLYYNHLQQTLSATYRIMLACNVEDLVISAGMLHPYFKDDQTKPFRTSPYFKTLCALAGPYHLIHIKITHFPPKLVVYSPNDFWHKIPSHTSHPRWEDLCAFYDTVKATEIHKRFDFIHPKQSHYGRSVIIADENIDHQDFELNPNDVIMALNMIRTRKTSWEVFCVLAANKIGVSGHKAVRTAFLADPNISERELYYVFTQSSQLIPEEFPYQPIIALDQNAAFLHYDQREKTHASSSHHSVQLLIDAGATYGGYNSDISRTTLRAYTTKARTSQGHPLSQATHQLYEQILTQLTVAQQLLAEQASSFRCWLDMNYQSQLMVVKILNDTGIITEIPDTKNDIIALAKIFYPHGLGHMLGALTHDFFPYRTIKNTDKKSIPLPSFPPQSIESGYLFTVEPGIYFIPAQLESIPPKLKSLINLSLAKDLIPLGGMRIEDNIFICKHGSAVNLTRLCEGEDTGI